MGDLEGAWRARREPRRRAAQRWLEAMPLYCRGGSEHAHSIVEHHLSAITGGCGEHAWEDTVALGIKRLCTECWQS